MNKLIITEHLKNSMEFIKSYVLGLISKVTSMIVDTVEELRKQIPDSLTKSDNQIKLIVNGSPVGTGVPLVDLKGDTGAPGTQGINLLMGTKNFSGDKWVTNVATNLIDFTFEKEKYNGLTVVSKSTAWNWMRQVIHGEKGHSYTFSFYGKSDVDQLLCQFYCNTGEFFKFNLSTSWKRYSHTFEATKDGDFFIYFDPIYNGKVYACGYKLEKGAVSDPVWTPAPQDLNGTNAYIHIRYSASSDGSDFIEKPTSKTVYIGIYNGTSATAPTDKVEYIWSKYKGEDGVSKSFSATYNSAEEELILLMN